MNFKRFFEFIAKNFATPIVFYIVFQRLGVKPAIAFGVSVAGLQILAHVYFRWRLSFFFILATGLTVVFGSLDLMVSEPRFFRLEAFFQNFVLGLIFLASLGSQRPMAWRLARSLPVEFQPDFSRLGKQYFLILTQIWGGYLLIKSALFLYLAFRVDLGRLYLFRVVVGNGTAVLLILGEFWVRKRLFR